MGLARREGGRGKGGQNRGGREGGKREKRAENEGTEEGNYVEQRLGGLLQMDMDRGENNCLPGPEF